MKYLLSLFAKPHHEDIIRDGRMYRLTYKGYRLIKEEQLEVFGGFTGLNVEVDNSTQGDRKRTDLNHKAITGEQVNFTKRPETM